MAYEWVTDVTETKRGCFKRPVVSDQWCSPRSPKARDLGHPADV